MATSPITRSTQRTASPVQGDNNHTSSSRGNPSAQNSIEQSVARADTDQASKNSQSTTASSLQYRRPIAYLDKATGKVHRLPTFSPVRSEAPDSENDRAHSSPPSTPRKAKRARSDIDAYSTPDRSTRFSTPTGTPQTAQPNRLPEQARTALTEIGIPEKAISKLEVIIAKTGGNYALCGSAALAVHMRSVGLPTQLNVDDLDVVYTGSNNTDWIAWQLTDALKSPQSKARATHGQILLAKLEIEGKGSFKIDLVPNKEQFATSYTNINGLSVASLDSLEVSYQLTEKGSYGEKSVAASTKLGIVSAIKEVLDSKKSSPT